jgi:hypothetical protein
MDKFCGTVEPPELVANAGTDFRLTHRYIRINVQSGFGSLNLAQTDGTVLALDWVVGKTHHIWGSAVMVAPGVALTARHVVDDMREKGFLGAVGGYLLALGFDKDGMAIWNPTSFGPIGEGDLSILTLVPATPRPATTVGLATLVARQPLVGESIGLIGFAAAGAKVEFENDAAIDLLGSVGPVIDVYPERRDRSGLPNPSAAVLAKNTGGMSGGAAFDAKGRLIGIIARGFDEGPAFISLVWPCIFTPVEVAWPPGLVSGPTSLAAMAELGLCRIERIEALHPDVNEGGELVGLTLDL